jgi:predicted amidohydrolase
MFVKLAVAQIAIGSTVEHNARKIGRFLDSAHEMGVSLIGFPEMCLTGYHTFVLSNPELNEQVDEALTLLQRKCRTLEMGAIVGHGWREGYALFNRATVLLPSGERVHYDKIHLAEPEQKFFHPGKTPLCFEFGQLKIGIIICRDQNDPYLASSLKEQGAEVLFILSAHYYPPKTARWKIDKNKALPIARAVENKMHVLLSNAVGTHLDFVSLGNSLIVDPDGCVVGLANEVEETILTVNLPE